jgi:type I restriction enzyme R subunit
MSLNEANTRAKLIDPALYRCGWTEDLIRREQTAGGIEIHDGQAHRRKKGRTDYLLRVRVNTNAQPVAVAVMEAKCDDDPPTLGLEQAKGYGARLHVPFVFSSNGSLFCEYNTETQELRTHIALAQFPTPDDLLARYQQRRGFALQSETAKPLLVPYRGGESGRRYYQDAAIRAVLEKIAAGGNRALL